MSIVTRRLCLSLLIILTLAAQAQVRSGIYRGRPVTYQLVNGRAVYEGDILLERVDTSFNTMRQAGTITYNAYLWPKVGSVFQVPYIIDPASGGVSSINAAITQFNSTFPGILQWVPRTSETDYVDINLNPNDFSGVCDAFVGRIGGEQFMPGSGSCAVATILHEMGHTIGLWHEQSRSDRDSYVEVNYNNVIKGSRSNFDQVLDNVQNLTLYDYASIMHYIPFAFSRNGGPTLESIPAGIPLSNLVNYTAGDSDGIMRLYGAIPTAVTVTSNPPGLQVIVDGSTVTTPQTFIWGLNSTHTLNVATAPQTVGGVAYTYGRWNDNTAASHTITVLPGNGELPFPPTSPAVTVYSANFIKLVPYAITIFPSGTGSVAPTPAPLAYPPASGVYYVARQQVTLTATPNAGQNFYAYFNSPFWLPGGLSANPKTFYVMDDGTGINTTAEFTSSPVYTVGASPAASNLGVLVDGGFWYAPKNFALPYDSTWTAGSSHNLNISSPQLPYSINTQYVFANWSDGGAQNHNVTLPSSTTAYTANVNPEFVAVDYPIESCGGTINVTPGPGGDGYYPSGQVVSFDQTPATGWTFTGWNYDLTGTSSPQNLTVSDEVLVAADYNTSATAFSITSLSPAAAVSGAGNLTLTINGTGFTSGTLVFVNNAFRASTFVSSTQLTVALTTADFATPGAFQIFAENFPAGAACAAFAARPFFVASHPLLTATPANLVFPGQAIATTSTSKIVTLKNNGTVALSISSIAASGNFAQTNTCSASLSVGASCTVTVTFTPTVSGAIAGAITVSDSSPDSPQVVALTGTGLTPLSISPATLAFGSVMVGKSSAAKTVTLTNNQSKTLNFSFAASGNYTAVGSGTSKCATTLAAKAKCTMSVTFAPKVNGAINGAVTITHDAAFSPQIASLSGTGTAGGTAPLTFTPVTLTFPSQVIGTTSSAKVVTVKNTSAASITFSSISTSGNYAAVGSGTTPCSNTTVLAASGSCTLSVTFSPSINGTIKGAVVISDNSSVSPQALNVSGTAVLAASLSPANLIFSAQAVGTTSASQTVTLTNNQNMTLALSTIVGSGDFTAVAGGTTPCGTVVAAKGKCTFVVTFTPSAVGTIPGAVTVTDSASGSPQIVTLMGTGQ